MDIGMKEATELTSRSTGHLLHKNSIAKTESLIKATSVPIEGERSAGRTRQQIGD
jgi:hypothetical protein